MKIKFFLILLLILPLFVLSQDFNNDGIVDRADLELMKTYIRTGNLLGDLNGDNRVDTRDLFFITRLANRENNMSLSLSSSTANTISLTLNHIDYVLVDSIYVKWSDSTYPTENTGILLERIKSYGTNHSNSYNIGQSGLTYITILIKPKRENFWMSGLKSTINVISSGIVLLYDVGRYDVNTYGN